MTQNFRIFNRSTIASFYNTVIIHEGCGMLLLHSYIFLIYFKNHNPETEPLWVCQFQITGVDIQVYKQGKPFQVLIGMESLKQV